MAYPLTVYFLLLVTIVGWGLWGYASKAGIGAVGVYNNIFLIYLSGCIAIGVIGYFTLPHGSLGFSTGLIYPIIGGVAMGVGSIAYFVLIQRYAVSIILPSTLLYVLVAVILSVVLLHEHLKLVHFLGIPLMIIGAYLLSQ